MDSLYISLVLMAVSGVTFIAYRHPLLYEEQFSPKIFIVSGLAVLAVMFHDAGVNTAFKDLTPFLKDGVGEQVKVAIQKSSFPEIFWGGVGSTFLYAFFLSWLADHMKKEYGLEEEEETVEEAEEGR